MDKTKDNSLWQSTQAGITSTSDSPLPVLLSLPRLMVVPPDVAAQVFALLHPYLSQAVEQAWGGDIKFLPSKATYNQLCLSALTPAQLATASLDSDA